jgi:hypothetical protein
VALVIVALMGLAGVITAGAWLAPTLTRLGVAFFRQPLNQQESGRTCSSERRAKRTLMSSQEPIVTVLIEASAPGRWQDLEARVARILMECGYDVEMQKNVRLARGDVNIDVWADDHSSPQNIIAVECKRWTRPATRNVVHGFRTVVGDSGANTGLIVSSAGFQKGAVEAAAYSNVQLLDWAQFQAMFMVQWFRHYMLPTLEEETDALHEYTEPINSRILRKAGALPLDRRERFKALRERYLPLAVSSLAFNRWPLTVCSPRANRRCRAFRCGPVRTGRTDPSLAISCPTTCSMRRRSVRSWTRCLSTHDALPPSSTRCSENEPNRPALPVVTVVGHGLVGAGQTALGSITSACQMQRPQLRSRGRFDSGVLIRMVPLYVKGRFWTVAPAAGYRLVDRFEVVGRRSPLPGSVDRGRRDGHDQLLYQLHRR